MGGWVYIIAIVWKMADVDGSVIILAVAVLLGFVPQPNLQIIFFKVRWVHLFEGVMI